MMGIKTIVVDFDGVISEYYEPWVSADFIPDKPVPGALAFIKAILEDPNYELKIFSNRNAQPGGIRAMQNWFKFWFIKEFGWEQGAAWGNELAKTSNSLPPSHVDYFKYFPLNKPPGWVTLDDRVMLFSGTFPTFK